MAIDLGSETVLKQERTSAVMRSTPARDTMPETIASMSMIIYREIIRRAPDGSVLSVTQITPPHVFTFAELEASPACAAYVLSCNAVSLLQMLGRESALYDALSVERNAAQAP